jgi:hypothetical protein
LQLQDNQKARWIHVDKENEYRTNAEEAVRSQEASYKFLKNKFAEMKLLVVKLTMKEKCMF